MSYSNATFYSSAILAFAILIFNLSEIYTFSNYVRKTVSSGSIHSLMKELASASKIDRGNSIFTITLLWASMIISWIIFTESSGRFSFPGPLYMYLLTGTIVISSGIIMRRWAMGTLGNLFTHLLTIQKGHKVIAKGPYGVVRHPSYLGGILIILGFGIAMANPISLALCIIIPIIAYSIRVNKEEAVLISNLGSEYKRYMGKVHYKIIPWIW